MPDSLFNTLILIKGAGDLASGVAYRLKRCGFSIVMTELPAPLLVRRKVAFGQAVFSGETTVEGITAKRVNTPEEAYNLAATETIPVLIDPAGRAVGNLQPHILVDAIMAKINTGTAIDHAPLVVALGPGFTAGQDCHAIIETNRGHSLGRVVYAGQAEPNTKTPGVVKEYTVDRVLRAPADGHVTGHIEIGEPVKQRQLIATVNAIASINGIDRSNAQEIRAPFEGVLRGLIHPKVKVTAGMKIGDLDPRGTVDHCFTISDKSLAIGGGVLEAVMASEVFRQGILE